MTDIQAIKSRISDWKALLTALGIAPKYLRGNHCPCPSCGGKDRFRFTNYHGNGDYICNQCGNGDGFDLLMKVFGYSFAEARDTIANHLGIDTKTPFKAPEKRFKPFSAPRQAITPKDSLKRIQGYLWGAKPVTRHCPVGKYLVRRGLDWNAIKDGLQGIYYREAVDYWTADQYGRPLKVSEYPAMVAKITKGGELMGVHLTYLHNDSGEWKKADIIHPVTGNPLPNKKMQSRYPSATRGACVALYPLLNDAIAVCEGIETALAVRQLFGLPVWACLSAGGLRAFEIPAGLQSLYIVADHDDNQIGQNAGRDLSHRAIRDGLTVKHWLPPTAGHDALDELRRRNRRNLDNPKMDNQ